MKRYFETTNRKLELFVGDKVIVKIFGETFNGFIGEFFAVRLGMSVFDMNYIIGNHKIKKVDE